MKNVRDNFKSMVKYLLGSDNSKDEELIDSYADTLMFGAYEYYTNKKTEVLSRLDHKKIDRIRNSKSDAEARRIIINLL